MYDRWVYHDSICQKKNLKNSNSKPFFLFEKKATVFQELSFFSIATVDRLAIAILFMYEIHTESMNHPLVFMIGPEELWAFAHTHNTLNQICMIQHCVTTHCIRPFDHFPLYDHIYPSTKDSLCICAFFSEILLPFTLAMFYVIGHPFFPFFSTFVFVQSNPIRFNSVRFSFH